MLVQYVCQETDPKHRNKENADLKSSNLNPNAKEFIPKNLMNHFVNNENNDYLNDAMLQSALKTSIAEANKGQKGIRNNTFSDRNNDSYLQCTSSPYESFQDKQQCYDNIHG